MIWRLVFLLVGLLPAAAGQASGLEQRISELFERPAARRAVWGVQAIDLVSGTLVYDANSANLFVPASVTKLYSTALALDRLGPEHRFRTVVTASAPIASGVLQGDLRLVGGGDPNLSARVIPYDHRAEFRQDRLAPLRELARQVKDTGVMRIEGDVLGDDTRYVWDPHASGWSVEDVLWAYGAPPGALSFNDSTIRLLIRPGAPGGPASVQIEPPGYYELRNLTRTAAARTVARALGVRMEAGSRAPRLFGEISSRSPGRSMALAADDPALFAAAMFKRQLEEAGVQVAGRARAVHRYPEDVLDLRRGPGPPSSEQAILAAIDSTPLRDALAIVNKASQNLHAEMLLREAALHTRGIGSIEAGIEELRAFLSEVGLTPWEFHLDDASGLSRKNLVCPAGTVKLLQAMWVSPHRDVYAASLPTAGEDGTLDWRFSKSPAKGRIKAKTGTLSHVTGLAGYARTNGGRDLAFAVFVNNYGVSASYIRGIVDEIAAALVEAPLPAETTGAAGQAASAR